MPRGLRKRGKKHKANTDSYNEEPHQYNPGEEHDHESKYDPLSHSEPSWIIPAASRNNDESVNPEAPFGYVDAEVKAYFRTVDLQIRDWQENKLSEEKDRKSVV